jgi:hypothetical protein
LPTSEADRNPVLSRRHKPNSQSHREVRLLKVFALRLSFMEYHDAAVAIASLKFPKATGRPGEIAL